MIDWIEKSLRGRHVVDALFYDLTALSPLEMAQVHDASEGALLVILPGREQGHIPVFENVAGLLASPYSRVDTAVIAGVGSSGVGTAALSRVVANALDRPVVGIVSSHGWRELLGEGIEGMFSFNPLDRLERTSRFVTGFWREMTREFFWGRLVRFHPGAHHLEGIAESETLLELLRKHQSGLKVLVGHSKGSLAIANALFGLREEGGIHNTGIHVVTLGCGVNVPEEYRHLHQFLGTLDPLGIANTTAKGDNWHNIHWVWFKGHDLNPFNRLHLPVGPILERLKAALAL
ncbi:MAG: hypothetical protein HQL82_02420 [Magnetococcales bacterium]|nr:hypothetical protein [Magnetococcales bacterium]